MPINYDPEAWKKDFQNYLAARSLTTGIATRPQELGALALAELQNRSAVAARNFELGLTSRELALKQKAQADETALSKERNALYQQQIENQYSLGQQQIDAAKANPAQSYISGAGALGKLATSAMQADKAGYFDWFKGSGSKEMATDLSAYGEGTQFTNPANYGEWETAGNYTGSVADGTIAGPEEMYGGIEAASYSEPIGGNLAGEALTGAEFYGEGTAFADAANYGTWATGEVAAGAEAGVDVAAQAGGATAGAFSSWMPVIGWSMTSSSLLGPTIGELGGEALGVGGKRERDIGGGIVAGAATGAAAGSFFPVVGTTVGGIVGGVVGGVSQLFGDSIVCTELNRQGLLSDHVLEKDSEYRKKNIPEDAYRGYLMAFRPVVEAMRRSRVVTALIAPFGIAAAHEMAHRADKSIPGSILGKAVLVVGIPLCRAWFYHKTRLALEVA